MKGSILTRGENTWLIRVEFPSGFDGKRRQKGETIKGSRKDAEKRLKAILREMETGFVSEPENITVA